MINRVVLMGRITQELELKQTPSGVSALNFVVAVDRSFVKQGEDRQADFISCVAWRQQAEFITRYFGKGRMIALEGQLRTRNYEDKNGSKHYVTEVYVDNVSFTGETKQGQQQSQTNALAASEQYGPEYEYRSAAPAPKQDTQSYARDPALEAEGIISDNGVPF